MKHIITGLFIVLVLCFGALEAEADDFEVSGYSEPQYLFLQNDVADVSSGWNRLRVDGKLSIADGLTVEADVIYLLYAARDDLYLTDFLPRHIRNILPPGTRSLFKSSVSDSLYFDNAFLKISKGNVDVTVGKQQLEFGPGYFRNPVNIFSSRDIIDPTYEKTGHKAVRGDVTLGPRSLLTVFMSSDDDLDDISNIGSAIRLTVPAGRFDLSFMFAEREWLLGDYLAGVFVHQQRYLYGFDAVGELLGAGVWVEAQYSAMERDEDFYELLAGVDYTFENRLYLMLEYYHGSQAAGDTDTLTLNDWLRYFNDEVLAVSSDQLYLFSEYPVSDNFKIGLAALLSLNDQSSAFVPSMRYTMLENLMLSIIGQVHTGKDGSAFGSQLGNGALCRLRYFF